MPVPWDPGRGLRKCGNVDLASKPQNRAITLKQLRELHAFIRSLAKVGLLRSKGERIEWSDVNMHTICHAVLKKLIPTSEGCSWVEIVAKGPQEPKHFVSHNWSEPFNDFMSSVELHAAEHGNIGSAAYWICTFANSQFEVALGVTLEECPFHQALLVASSTVLMLDKTANALTRSWCSFELWLTTTCGKKLEICTPSGPVGCSRASSGEILEAIKHLDLRRAKASEPVDQRQIMNKIAGVPEMTGICTRGTTKWLDAHCVPGEYEVELMKTHTKEFEEVNDRVKQTVSHVLQGDSAPRGPCCVEDAAFRALSIAQLRAFSQLLKAECDNGNVQGPTDEEPRQYEKADIHAIQHSVVRPKTEQAKISYMELISEGPQHPEFYVTHCYDVPFPQTISALNWHAQARRLADSTTYWICVFARRLWEPEEEYLEDSIYHKALVVASGLIAVLEQDAAILRRSWCCLEIYEAFEAKKVVDLTCSTGALAATRPFEDGGVWECGCFNHAIAHCLVGFEVQTSETSVKGERDKIFEWITGEKMNHGAGFSRAQRERLDDFNFRFRSRGAGPVLRQVGRAGAIELIREVQRCAPSLRLASAQLTGVFGETALHVAAGAGNIHVVEELLILRLDPNVQDNQGETALHYAAFAGHAKVAMALLHGRADVTCESWALETPVEIAKLNPARFLEVETEDVLTMLSNHAARAGGNSANCLVCVSS